MTTHLRDIDWFFVTKDNNRVRGNLIDERRNKLTSAANGKKYHHCPENSLKYGYHYEATDGIVLTNL